MQEKFNAPTERISTPMQKCFTTQPLTCEKLQVERNPLCILQEQEKSIKHGLPLHAEMSCRIHPNFQSHPKKRIQRAAACIHQCVTFEQVVYRSRPLSSPCMTHPTTALSTQCSLRAPFLFSNQHKCNRSPCWHVTDLHLMPRHEFEPTLSSQPHCTFRESHPRRFQRCRASIPRVCMTPHHLMALWHLRRQDQPFTPTTGRVFACHNRICVWFSQAGRRR